MSASVHMTPEEAVTLIMTHHDKEKNTAKTMLALLVLIGEIRREAYSRGYAEGNRDCIEAVLT